MKKIVKNKKTVRIVSTLLALITLLTCFPLMTSCSRPPELAQVKDELIALLEGSYVINDILFGAGLTTEYDESGLYDEYTEEIQNFESYYSDDQIFHYFYSPVVATTKDGTKQYTSINEIKDAALKIYSEDYLRKVFVQAFEGETVTVNGKTKSVKPRYREDTEDGSEDGEKVLRKYKFIGDNKMDYINSRGGRTVYDYDTMKIIKPSDKDTLVVEIHAYYQDYTLDSSASDVDDWVSVPSGYSWHAVRLYFVKQNGEWRLDAGSY